MFGFRRRPSKRQMEIAELKQKLGNYMADQEIWLTKCDGLEKENAQLKKELEGAGRMYELAKAFHDEKCAEFDLLLHDYQQEQKLRGDLDAQLREAKERLHWIWAIGVDYDGCNTVTSLKELIDELVAFTQKDDVPIFGSVAPRAAKWIKAECSEKDGDATCSHCGHWDWSDSNYCSACGSRMTK